MVKFGKSGSAVTSAAVRLARAFTGRSKVLVPTIQPFFSLDDWFISTTPMDMGIPKAVHRDVHRFSYGDSSSLQTALQAHEGEVACVIMEPLTSTAPCIHYSEAHSREEVLDRCAGESCAGANYLAEVRELCDEHGSLLIIDEMITGFRWSLEGANAELNARPDLVTFGKAIANGFPLSFLAGRREVMSLGGILPEGAERTFLLSSTHGPEMASLGAFLAVAKIYKSRKVIEHLWSYGKELRETMRSAITEAGLGKLVSVDGPACLLSLNFNRLGERQAFARTLFLQEMTRGNVLMPWISPSLAHDERSLKVTSQALEISLDILARAVFSDNYEALESQPVKPVFRKLN